MTQAVLNTQLYQKMFAEQERFKGKRKISPRLESRKRKISPRLA